MTQTTDSLRVTIIPSKAGQKRWICPPDLKKEIVQHARSRRDTGAQLKVVAKELGVSLSVSSDGSEKLQEGFSQFVSLKIWRLEPNASSC